VTIIGTKSASLGNIARAFLLFALFAALCSPASAQRDPDWEDCASSQGNPDDNIAACNRIIRSGKEAPINLSIAYQNRGYQFGRKNETDAAIADYSEAIRVNPSNAQAWTNRGARLQRKKEYQRAIDDHTQAIRLDPNHKDAWYNRGNVYQEMGNKERAIADYKEALRVNPNDDDARTNLRQLGVNP
jgi:tetratricopeptide (TPR) repeat protein